MGALVVCVGSFADAKPCLSGCVECDVCVIRNMLRTPNNSSFVLVQVSQKMVFSCKEQIESKKLRNG